MHRIRVMSGKPTISTVLTGRNRSTLDRLKSDIADHVIIIIMLPLLKLMILLFSVDCIDYSLYEQVTNIYGWD